MNRILVSILSDYLISNFLLIKEMKDQYDKLVFITTQNMLDKKKGHYLELSLGIASNSVSRIVVKEDDIYDITEKLKDSKLFDGDHEYIINLTGGTKIMAIAIHDFFHSFDHTSFYYIPIGKNIIADLNNTTVIPLKYRINLKEYFLLNGLSFVAKTKFMHNRNKANEVFAKCKAANFDLQLVKEIQNAHFAQNSEDRKYYSGEWFEEYSYYRIKEELDLSDEYIATSAYIQREDSQHIHDNEIDIMFVINNELYVCECKVSLGSAKNTKAKTETYLYKLAAISKDFGLKVKSYLMTLQNLSDENFISNEKYEMLNDRAYILGIKGILDCNNFKNNKKLM